MTSQGDHVVLKCSGDACGMRYPSPATDPRRDSCPLCESPVAQVAVFSSPPAQPPPVVAAEPVIVAVLDNIRSALNVGTMLRSADGAGLAEVYLGGLTAPVDNPKVIKTALGAEMTVPTTSCLDTVACIESLRADGFAIWALDYTARSEALEAIGPLPARLAFVVGNERAGVDPAILEMADRHIHLTMWGAKTTVNVGVAFGTVAYWMRAHASV